MQNQKTKNSFTKKIGNATYQVKIYFSPNGKDNFNDKLLRIIKNDIAGNPKAS